MDLLPRSHTEFVSEDYWDKFYKKRGSKAFEWYGEYPELCGILGKYVKTQDKILMVGCGNSKLSEDMYDVGYGNMVNIDISDIVIRQMTEKNQKTRPNMTFLRMDVTQTSFADGEFSVAIDKGTLDALMVDSSEEVVTTVDKMFGELSRVLRVGGRYVCISLLQEHIVKKVFNHFNEMGWPIRVHRVEKELSADSGEKEFTLPAFVIILTKFKKMPNITPMLEVCNIEDKIERHEKVQTLITIVKEMQYYAMVKQQISRKNVSGDQPSVCLYTSTSSEPRYTLYVVDRPQKSTQKFAVFIVPQGRETDWLFNQAVGRKQLADSAGFERLVVVVLHRTHKYTDMEDVKYELNGKVMELVPPNFKKGTQVPYLSLGDDIGEREVHAEGYSEMNGKYVVEDVRTDDGCHYRRLIFLDTANIVQSEAKLIEKSKRKGKTSGGNKLTLDWGFLPCQHHVAMVGTLTFFPDIKERERSLLLIGLGGGGLPCFLRHHFNKLKLEVVDFDPDVLKIAEKHFFFQQDPRLKVQIADGLQFIHKAVGSGSKYDMVMFDVDSKDRSVGISCPPVAFIEEDFLRETEAILTDDGVFVLNLVARDETLKVVVMNRLKDIFSQVLTVHVEEELNVIIFCLKAPQTPPGDAPGPSGDAGKSSCDAVRASGDAAKSSGDAAKSSSDAAKSSSDAAKSSGDAVRSSCDALATSKILATLRTRATDLNKMIKTVSSKTEVDVNDVFEKLSLLDGR